MPKTRFGVLPEGIPFFRKLPRNEFPRLQSVVIRFFDAEGLDIDENAQRKIERMYHREDFRRVLAPEIGDIDFPARAVEQYTADLVAPSRWPTSGPRGSSWSSTSPTGRPASSCPTCWPRSTPTSWW